jgi:hypothetical protein
MVCSLQKRKRLERWADNQGCRGDSKHVGRDLEMTKVLALSQKFGQLNIFTNDAVNRVSVEKTESNISMKRIRRKSADEICRR